MSQDKQAARGGKPALPKIGRRRVRGVVLYAGPGFDGRRIVAIATFRTSNTKTGQMAQIWILRARLSPVEVLTRGLDRSICGTCIHRGRASGGAGTCYVNLRAPQSVWRAWEAGRYPEWDGTDAQLAALFAGRAVRFGAYGDPALVPSGLVGRIAGLARRHTGYTHAWTTSPEHRPYLRASVDSVTERQNARSHGWRVARVGKKGTQGDGVDGATGRREITCPATEEAGQKTTCERCGLCAGSDKAGADVLFPAHGPAARRVALMMA
jgi:hypothetical protein